MLGRFRDMVRNSLFRIRDALQLDRALVIQGQIKAEQNLAKGALKRLSDAGFGVFSQTDEDGILSWLIDRIGLDRSAFVEFGVHDYRESNTRYLLQTRNWPGLIIDGDPRNIAAVHGDGLTSKFDLQAISSFITRENISGLIEGAGFRGRLGLLSVDIDGVDYWVLERAGVEADIVVVEYNDFLGDQPVSVPYSPTFVRHAACAHGVYWGASLAGFRFLLEAKGYVFVGTNVLGVNAFFVHGDHAAKVRAYLENVVAHPCVMREARNVDGSLSYKKYGEFIAQAASLPLIRVDTGETITLGDVCRR